MHWTSMFNGIVSLGCRRGWKQNHITQRKSYDSPTKVTFNCKKPMFKYSLEYSGGMRGTAADIEIHAREILEMRHRLNILYAHHTKQSLEKIGELLIIFTISLLILIKEKSMERDYFMTPQEAKNFGLIDRILEKRK